MPSPRPILALAALLVAPGPWVLEQSIEATIAHRIVRCADGSDACGRMERVSLDAGGLRLGGVRTQRRGVWLSASAVEVRPAWDGVDVHVEGLEVARASAGAAEASSTSPATPGPSTSTSIDTHGLTVRIRVAGTTVLTTAGVTALLDEPAVTIGPDGIPQASVGLTLQHARGSLHSQGRLRAVPRANLRTWAITGALRVADGPPLALRSEVGPEQLRVVLEHESGGWLDLSAWPPAKTATVELERFALHGLGRLGLQERGGLVVDAQAATVSGRVELGASRDAVSIHAEDLEIEGLRVEHPKLARDPILLGQAWIDGDMTVSSTDHFDADLTVGHDGLALSAHASMRPSNASLSLDLPQGPCQRLFDALPQGFADPMRGTRVEGELAGALKVSVDFDAAHARAALLERDPLAQPPAPGTLDVVFPFRDACTVVSDPAALDLAALRGPYRHRFVDADGTPRSILIADGAPHTVSLEDIPLVAGAFVTLEDSRYFAHDGLDLEQVANAVWHNLAQGEVQRGASTITQQAARNLFLGLDRSAARKLQEAFLATRIDAEVGKRRLLEIYLNIIELAPGVHGVEDAAQFYFGKSADQLTPLQATHLAMLAPAPRTYAERFVSGEVDAQWNAELRTHVRRLARHHVIERPKMLAALRGELGLLDRTAGRQYGLRTLDAREEPGAEAVGQARLVEDPLRGCGDVVLHALELEVALARVVDRVAGPGIVIPGLPDRPDRDDVPELRMHLEVLGDDLIDAFASQRVRLAQMGVTDEGHLAQVFPDRNAGAGLIDGEDVLELLEVQGGPVAEVHTVVLRRVRQALEPLHVL